MTINKKALVLPVLGLLLTFGVASPARADVLILTLDSPLMDGVPGSTVSFSGTLSAPITNSADLFLNSDSDGVDFPLAIDDTPFFNISPLDLAPGATVDDVLFTVTIPNFATFGQTYNGFFEIDGGGDLNTFDDLATVTFQVQAAPEPNALILLLTMLFGMAVVIWRKRSLA